MMPRERQNHNRDIHFRTADRNLAKATAFPDNLKL